MTLSLFWLCSYLLWVGSWSCYLNSCDIRKFKLTKVENRCFKYLSTSWQLLCLKIYLSPSFFLSLSPLQHYKQADGNLQSFNEMSLIYFNSILKYVCIPPVALQSISQSVIQSINPVCLFRLSICLFSVSREIQVAKHYFVQEIQLKLCGFLFTSPANKRQVVPNQSEANSTTRKRERYEEKDRERVRGEVRQGKVSLTVEINEMPFILSLFNLLLKFRFYFKVSP